MTRCPAGGLQEKVYIFTYLHIHHCVLLPIVHYIMRSVSRCQAVHHELLLPACCLVANIPAFMGHGTWDMGHSSIISLCRVEQSGGEWSGVDSEDSEDRMQLLVTSTSPTLG